VVRVEGLAAAVGLAAVETADLVAVPVRTPLRLAVQIRGEFFPCLSVLMMQRVTLRSANRNSARLCTYPAPEPWRRRRGRRSRRKVVGPGLTGKR
jgi:hypothetical protein